MLVWHDLLGLYHGRAARFVKRYAEIGDTIRAALAEYAEDVREHRFPQEQHTYAMPDDELAIFEAAASDRHAALLHAEGRFAEAVDAGSYAAGISDVPQAVKQGLVWAVESALALGERVRADELLTAVEALPPGLRAPFLEAQTQRFRARMSNDEAGFKSAAAGFREYDIPFWLAVTLLEHSELTGDAALLDEAHEIFEELKATPWLERAGALARTSAEPVPAPS